MNRHVGFTGTQRGMSSEQLAALDDVLFKLHRRLGFEYLHHGDCIGSDEQAHRLGQEIGYRIILHPPMFDHKRARCEGCWLTREAMPYLDRNRQIVNESEVLIGTPAEEEEQLRSGTWATIRHARRTGKAHYVIFPSGARHWFGPVDLARRVMT